MLERSAERRALALAMSRFDGVVISTEAAKKIDQKIWDAVRKKQKQPVRFVEEM
jgi:hypothetical protein